MPKAPRKKYYAVRVGREGQKIYDTWEEVGTGYPRPLCEVIQRTKSAAPT